MQRTYGSKGARRRQRIATRSPSPEPTDDAATSSPVRPRKRQRVDVEVVFPTTSKPSGASGVNVSPSHPRGYSGAIGNTNSSVSRNSSHVKRKASPPTMSNQQKPDTVSTSQTLATPHSSVHSYDLSVLPISPRNLSSDKKAAKDLAGLFNFAQMEPASSKTPTGPKPSTSVAKGMLRRAATHSTSSISTSTGNSSFEMRHTSSEPQFMTPRKLAKTHSDSIIDLTSGSPFSRSRPLTPSKTQSVEDVSFPAMQRPSLASSHLKTYAGASRSFLVALPAAQYGSASRNNSQLEDDDILQMQSQEDDIDMKESYTDLRLRWGVDNSEEDFRPPSDDLSPRRRGRARELIAPPLPPGMMNDLKSITELRSKGESRRFMDDVGYLFEGLAANAVIGVRRASALEIVTKLCDLDFARKSKAADFLGRAWEVLREAEAGDGDKVLDAILVFFAALASRDTSEIADLAAKTDMIPVLYRLLGSLERSNDPLWLISCSLSDADLKRVGIFKVEKTMLIGLEKLVRKKSALINDGDSVSNRVLISMALTALPGPLHKSTELTTLFKSLSHELAPLESRISAYTSGLSLITTPSSTSCTDFPSFLHIDNCLRLLDSFLLGRWVEDDEERSETILENQRECGFGIALIVVCVACDIVSRDSEYNDYSASASRCMESAFRVLINLTHDSLPWTQAVLDDYTLLTLVRLAIMSQRQRMEGGEAATEIKHEDDATLEKDSNGDSDTASYLDRLCLALGVLTNLVQVSYQAKEMLRDLQLDFNCAGKRACTQACSCASRVSALECLTCVYLQHCASEHELDVVVRGHMAVLFGMLMQGSAANQRILLSALPGSSNGRKIRQLVEHAQEFTSFYVDFSRKLSAMGHSQSTDEDGLDAPSRDTRDTDIAQDVVIFLESLSRQLTT